MAWEVKKLGDVCEISAGDSAPQDKKMFDKGDHLFFRTSDVGKIHVGVINDSADKLNELGVKKLTLFKKGTLLFPKSGASTFLNHRVLMGEDGYVSSHLATIKANNDYLNDKFLFYFSLNIDSRNLMQDQNYPSLRLSDIQDITILVPPLSEQERIVAILDKAFERIAKAKENTEKNANNAKEIFESYLQNVFKKKGEGWEEKTLNKLSENLDSKRVPITKSIRNSGSIPYYGASGIVDHVNDFIFNEDLLLISEDGANLLARTYPIAFSISGKTWVNNHAHVLRFKDRSTQKFVELYLNSIKLDDFVSGMAQPKLNQTMLNKIPIPVLPMDEQEKILQKVERISTKIMKLTNLSAQKLIDLEELKKSVLQKTFKGELTGASV